MEQYALEELEAIILGEKFPRDEAKQKEAMRQRKYLLDKIFDFQSEENREHIQRINTGLLHAMHELYDKVAYVKRDLDKRIAEGEHIYKDYALEGKIYWQIDIDNVELTRERKLLDILTSHAHSYWEVNASDGTEMENRVDCLSENLNWDIELFHPMRQWGVHICYATHTFFVDDDVLSLQDMKLLQAEDIYTQVMIYL